jgi:hypothetical protein
MSVGVDTGTGFSIDFRSNRESRTVKALLTKAAVRSALRNVIGAFPSMSGSADAN